ncbi:MAG: universal stress protein [Chloroherpetonaceae bacterium]|nr:universal stress protein [Chloroherpetonaceae bacterium]MCS7211808.1 universal stress protein [Chloroherpetonaceae bacterium]MDW8020006.1 universal stress protein [Chloroherpetonaceae bacterium]
MQQAVVRNILCPVDFSPQSQAVVEHATKVAEIFNSKITILNVVDDLAPEYAPYRKSSSDISMLRRTLEQDSQNRMKMHIQPRLRTAQSVAMLTAFGKPTEMITRIGKEQHAGLIMMATRSMGITNQFILGSTTYRIIRTAPCPLMVFSRPEQKFRPIRLLFPTDFSELSQQALPYLFKFAKEYDSDVHLVHFRQVQSTLTRDPKLEMDALKRTATLNGLKRLFVNDHIEGITPGGAILKYAKEHAIDLIILSAHGASGFKQFFLGTTAVEVSSRSECPVLVVRKIDWSL